QYRVELNVSFGWAADPESCLSRKGAAPPGRFSWCVPVVRSSSSRMVLASMTAGMAKITMNDCTSIAQQNIGMRLSDIPGARILKIVAISSVATQSAETSVNVIIWAQKSTRLPGEKSGTESGGYANQPASRPVIVKKPQY